MSHSPVPSRHRSHASAMRRAMTDAELKLWNELRAHRLMGLGFRRQVPIAGFIVDFACPAAKLVVEVDGAHHHGTTMKAAADERRSRALATLGRTVIRFSNDDVLRAIDSVCSHILGTAGSVSATPSPAREVRP